MIKKHVDVLLIYDLRVRHEEHDSLKSRCL